MKKLFLILFTILLSTAFAKEVDLNKIDFLGIKYGTSKKEVEKQLKDMNLDYRFIKDDKIEVNSFKLELYEVKIDKVYLSFYNDLFFTSYMVFNKINTDYTEYIEAKILSDFKDLSLEAINAVSKDNIILKYDNYTDKIIVQFAFTDTANYICEEFIISFMSLIFSKK